VLLAAGLGAACHLAAKDMGVARVGTLRDRLWAGLQVLFVPPSMHRIHHSVVIRERNTNYGTIFSVWDRMLGTLLIGVGAYQAPEKLRLGRLLVMPFMRPVQ